MTDAPLVTIIDDDADVRMAIALLLRVGGLRVESHPSAWAYLARFDPGQAGCLVLDIRMPDMSGLELQERLAREPLAPPIVLITGHGDVPMAVRAVKAGAVDFLEKPFADEALFDAVRRALALDARRRAKYREAEHAWQLLQRLTEREREILERIVAGQRNKAIALDLGIAQSTVEAHRAKLMEKLQADSLTELIRLARQTRLPPAG